MKLYLVFEHYKGTVSLIDIFLSSEAAEKDADERNNKEEHYKKVGYPGPKSHFQVDMWETQS